MSSTICISPQVFLQEQDYLLIDETDQIILDFRAPPPSPTGSSRRSSSVTNDVVLSEFLESTLRVPDLILPNNKIFPRQKPSKEIPVIDFEELKINLSKDDYILKIKESLEEIGCFQVINHGISQELMKIAMRRAARIFRLSPEKKRIAVRSPTFPFGFEEVVADNEEGVGEMMIEEFVWSKSCGFKVKMEGIWPLKYSKFSTKMESLASDIDKLAKDILLLINVITSDDQGESLINKRQDDNDSVCHIYKHSHGVEADKCLRYLQYDMIKMMIRGCDYSHALALHICDGSSEFHVYSKKGWASFVPLQNALVVTFGDQIQARTGGRFKQAIGKPIYSSKKEDCISMASLYSCARNNSTNGKQIVHPRTISLRDQALIAILLAIACQFLLDIYNRLIHL